jgi:cellulose synthase/poly-beta-1,6-N-acetylglucosamine synthase-like glycosyltransferase
VKVIDIVVAVAAGLLVIPALVFLLECLLAHHARAWRCRLPASQRRPKTTVLVPAHDEEAILGRTLTRLKAELGPTDRLLVVADACKDRTAEIARGIGAEVIERNDPSKPGKGHAVAFGLRHLELDPPEVVIVVDADCTVGTGSIDSLARHAAGSGRPVQAEYVLLAPEPENPSALSAVAFALRNRVRLAGLRALNLPCPLVGSGMAFPFSLIRRAPVGSSAIAEDLELGISLALLGAPPVSCPDATITGFLPDRVEARKSQRRRWEHGHLTTWATKAPQLVWAGIRDGRPALFAMALDLSVPPLSLLVLLLLLAAGAGGLIAATSGVVLPLFVALTGLVLVATGIGAALPIACRGVAHRSAILHAPAYLVSKVPAYLDLVRHGPERRWVRTERGNEGPA